MFAIWRLIDLKSCTCFVNLQFNDMVNVPFSSEAFVAGILAYFLDNTIHKKDGSIRKDRGKHWWDKFHSFKTDPRSEEFYSLPFNLNKYFPSVWNQKGALKGTLLTLS